MKKPVVAFAGLNWEHDRKPAVCEMCKIRPILHGMQTCGRSHCQEAVPRPQHIANHAMLVVNHNSARATGPEHSVDLSDRLGRVWSVV